MMANLTEEEEERLEPQPHVKANIPAIVALISKNGQVHRAEERGEKARSDLGNLYKKIQDDHHGNTKAVKLIRTLEKGSIDAAYDFMRTFMALAKHFNLIPENDLSDISEGGEPGAKVFEFPGGAKDKSPLDKARDHLGTSTKPEAEETPAQKRKRERGFDENPPPGAPGDTDLVDAGGPDKGETVQ